MIAKTNLHGHCSLSNKTIMFYLLAAKGRPSGLLLLPKRGYPSRNIISTPGILPILDTRLHLRRVTYMKNAPTSSAQSDWESVDFLS